MASKTVVFSGEAGAFPNLRSKRYPATRANPHLRTRRSVRGVMGQVLIALAPAVIGSIYLFGPGVLPYYLISVAAALAADLLVQLVKHRKVTTFDLSPVVTGVLLAMSLPLGVPLWFPILGAVVGIVVAKELFGGIGFNFLNPALAGRAVLRLAFSEEMMKNPVPMPPFAAAPDAVAGATPLMTAKQHLPITGTTLLDSFLGDVPGKLGETSALLLLIGGVFLLARGIIRFRIPLAFFATTAVMAFVLGGPAGLFSADWRLVLVYLVGGASMLGGFFMITDYSSSPTDPRAQYLFGGLCGIVNMLFRLYSPWSEGFTFAILIVNFTVPLMNRFIRPRVLGEKRGNSRAEAG